MTDNETAHFTQRDRVTLIQVETKLDRVIEDVKALTNSFAGKDDLIALEARVSKIESGNTWLIRLILGVVILGVLSLVIISK